VKNPISIREWVDGLKSPGGALATRSETKSEAAGHAFRGAIEGGIIGTAVGAADSLIPSGVSTKQLGIAAATSLLGSVALAHKPIGRTLSNATVALFALAAREYSGTKTAHAAGTSSNVLNNKAKKIAAHGEDSFGFDGGEDRLIAKGAEIFGS
jgi:hypothetical protein